MAADTLVTRRRSRLGLYGPFLALVLLAVGWTIAWFVIRDRVVGGLDQWVAAEAAAGRRWICPDRAVAGYPFRIEIACPSLALERPDVSASLGRLLVVSQVYRPGHLIAEAAGPLRLQAGQDRVEASWTLLQASVVTTAGSQRAAIVVDAPAVRIVSAALGQLDLAARRLETHVRPDPADGRTADLAVTATGAVVPGLDALVGGSEPADIEVVTAVSQAYDLPARPLWSELERWRVAGGQVALQRLVLAKGPRRIEAKGSFGIDDLHRPEARIEASSSGIEGVLGRFVGDRSGLAAGLLGALLGGGRTEVRAPRSEPDAAAPRLRPWPPVRVEGGRLVLGPLSVPGVRIPALY